MIVEVIRIDVIHAGMVINQIIIVHIMSHLIITDYINYHLKSYAISEIQRMKLVSLAEQMIGQLYPYQQQLYNNKHSEIIINKSRQVGVSYAIACMALLRAAAYGKTELIVSPSLRQSKHMMEYIYGFLNQLRKHVNVPVVEETKTSVIFGAGPGAIHSLPNSANTIRGYPADDIYLDEFAHFTCGTDKDIIDAITPSISRGGNIYYISTPFGDQNLFHKYWHENNNINKMVINWKDCPDFKKENIDSIRQTIGLDAFEQEYNNAFLSDLEGQEFPMDLIQRCIDHELSYDDLQKDVNYVVGTDIGRRNDLTAVCAISKNDGVYTLVNKETMRDRPYDLPDGNGQLQYFEYILNNYNINRFTIDESGIGNMLAEKLSQGRNIERVTFNNENKQEMVGNLKKIMQEGRLRFPDDPQLINSIRAIQRIYTPSNYLRFDSGRDSVIGHADLFWALALALYRCEESGFKVLYG